MYSGRPLSAEGQGKLNNQIIDASWVCPGQSETPSVGSIIAQCRSIKSWLDIRHDNIAFVHCSNGRTRSGVLVACLLKYIGAFERASDAFDFFCRTRYFIIFIQILHILSNVVVLIFFHLLSDIRNVIFFII